MRRNTLSVALVLALSAASLAARAQRLRLADAVRMLNAGDADEVRMGIEALATVGSERAATALAERIRRGLPPELLDIAVETLGLLGERSAGPVLFELTHHRRAAVRRAAVEAIGQCRPPGAADALVAALSDLDPRVRGSAALGLGPLRATGALDTLFLALDRGVLEAASAIGQLADAEAVDRLLGYLGRLPFDALAPALDELFGRREVPRRVKLRVVERVAELATGEARAYLEQLADAVDDPEVRRAAQEATQQIVEGG